MAPYPPSRESLQRIGPADQHEGEGTSDGAPAGSARGWQGKHHFPCSGWFTESRCSTGIDCIEESRAAWGRTIHRNTESQASSGQALSASIAERRERAAATASTVLPQPRRLWKLGSTGFDRLFGPTRPRGRVLGVPAGPSASRQRAGGLRTQQAGHQDRGSSTHLEEPGEGHDRITKLSVPLEEVPAAQRLLCCQARSASVLGTTWAARSSVSPRGAPASSGGGGFGLGAIRYGKVSGRPREGMRQHQIDPPAWGSERPRQGTNTGASQNDPTRLSQAPA